MNEAQREYRRRFREVWGVDPTERKPGELPTDEQMRGGPTLITRTAPPAPTELEHRPTCTADEPRVEAVGYVDGRVASRCIECGASAVVAASSPVSTSTTNEPDAFDAALDSRRRDRCGA